MAAVAKDVQHQVPVVEPGDIQVEASDVQAIVLRPLHDRPRGGENLLKRHLLAFADHGAEFYAGKSKDRRRALKLARANVANRRRAVR